MGGYDGSERRVARMRWFRNVQRVEWEKVRDTQIELCLPISNPCDDDNDVVVVVVVAATDMSVSELGECVWCFHSPCVSRRSIQCKRQSWSGEEQLSEWVKEREDA